MRNKKRMFVDAMEFGDRRKPKSMKTTRHHLKRQRRKRVIHIKHRMSF